MLETQMEYVWITNNNNNKKKYKSKVLFKYAIRQMCSKASLYFVAIWAATKFSGHESWSVKSDFLMCSRRGRL